MSHVPPLDCPHGREGGRFRFRSARTRSVSQPPDAALRRPTPELSRSNRTWWLPPIREGVLLPASRRGMSRCKREVVAATRQEDDSHPTSHARRSGSKRRWWLPMQEEVFLPASHPSGVYRGRESAVSRTSSRQRRLERAASAGKKSTVAGYREVRVAGERNGWKCWRHSEVRNSAVGRASASQTSTPQR